MNKMAILIMDIYGSFKVGDLFGGISKNVVTIAVPFSKKLIPMSSCIAYHTSNQSRQMRKNANKIKNDQKFFP